MLLAIFAETEADSVMRAIGQAVEAEMAFALVMRQLFMRIIAALASQQTFIAAIARFLVFPQTEDREAC